MVLERRMRSPRPSSKDASGGEKLRVRIDSECKHCSRVLIIEVDDQLGWKVVSAGASPLLFEPDMDWKAFSGANIIHDY